MEQRSHGGDYRMPSENNFQYINKGLFLSRMSNSDILWTQHPNQYEISSHCQSSVRTPNQKGYRLQFDDFESEQKQSGVKIKRTQSFPLEKLVQSLVEKDEVQPELHNYHEERQQDQHVIETYSIDNAASICKFKTQNILPGPRLIERKNKQSDFKNPLSQTENIGENTTIKVQKMNKLQQLILTLKTFRKQIKEVSHQTSYNKQRWVNEYNRYASQNIQKMISEISQLHNKLTNKAGSKAFNKHHKKVQLEEIENLKEKLGHKSVKVEQYKRTIEELQSKLRKSQIEKSVKMQRNQEESRLNDQIIRKKFNKLEQQIMELKHQKEDALAQVLKYKNLVRERQHQIQLRAQEHGHLLKQIKIVKDQLDEALSRQRKNDMNVKLYEQKYAQEVTHMTGEINKHKQEANKFRELLKNSEDQLKQCESFLNSVNAKIKFQEEQIQLSNNKNKEEQLKYFNKLQYFDKALLEVENCLGEMVKNQQQKDEHYKSREVELQGVRDEFLKKEVDLKCKQQELEELKMELKHQFMKLERKEESMMAEYKMAIDIQNASKDKWYRKYYQMFSDRKQSSVYSSSPLISRQSPVINIRPSFPRKTNIDIPVRERSPRMQIKDHKVRSQYNLRTQNFGSDTLKRTRTKRQQLKSPQSFRDFSISSRINNLRMQLDKELKQTNLK